MSVVLPASGWLMMAKVRRRFASWSTSVTGLRLRLGDASTVFGDAAPAGSDAYRAVVPALPGQQRTKAASYRGRSAQIRRRSVAQRVSS